MATATRRIPTSTTRTFPAGISSAANTVTTEPRTTVATINHVRVSRDPPPGNPTARPPITGFRYRV